jgi:hypothetical protein
MWRPLVKRPMVSSIPLMIQNTRDQFEREQHGDPLVVGRQQICFIESDNAQWIVIPIWYDHAWLHPDEGQLLIVQNISLDDFNMMMRKQ